jgi:NDP-sugar pyrophosphorylase family protein
MKAFLLAAGFGRRFAPVTERIPKAIFPYLNVPLATAHLRRLRQAGFLEAGINLHHLAQQVRAQLRDGAPDLPQLHFFPEEEILGTAGALRNAAQWLAGEDFLLVNADAAIEPDFRRLLDRHRQTRRAVTLLLVENRDPDRYTPLQAEGDRVTGFGVKVVRPLLYTGVCVLSARLLARLPAGQSSLVADLWRPLLAEGRDELGWVFHEGPVTDLGRPRDFLRASLEALDRAGPFPAGSGDFDAAARVLSLTKSVDATRSVLGRIAAHKGVRIRDSVVWDGVVIGPGAELRGCLAAAGRIAAGARFEDVLLWPGPAGDAAACPLD